MAMEPSLPKDSEARDEMTLVQRRGPPRMTRTNVRDAPPSVVLCGRFAALDESGGAEAKTEAPGSQEQQEQEVEISKSSQGSQELPKERCRKNRACRRNRASRRHDDADEERLLAQMASEAALEQAGCGPEGAVADLDLQESRHAAADPPRRAAAPHRAHAQDAAVAPKLAAMAFATQLLAMAGGIAVPSAPAQKAERRQLAAQPLRKADLWGDGGKRPVAARQFRTQLSSRSSRSSAPRS
mmetsp:Transcript_45211/g.98810  ORF Transcript_45211/g.98810 Transcript_45211/m.98810 type:complete len:241 (-) Transcript_45211:67-789(-)